MSVNINNNGTLIPVAGNSTTVSLSHTGTASSTGVRKQVTTVNSVDYAIDGSAYMEQSVTLSTSDVTTVTFTNAIIQTTSLIEYACSKWGIVPDDITASNGSCVITIPKQSNAETVSIRIYVR